MFCCWPDLELRYQLALIHIVAVREDCSPSQSLAEDFDSRTVKFPETGEKKRLPLHLRSKFEDYYYKVKLILISLINVNH